MSHLVFKQLLEARSQNANRGIQLSETMKDVLVVISLTAIMVAKILITFGGQS